MLWSISVKRHDIEVIDVQDHRFAELSPKPHRRDDDCDYK